METNVILILGHLNYDCIGDESLSSNPFHYIESLYLLTQLIETPTRVTRKSSEHIDLIIQLPQKTQL